MIKVNNIKITQGYFPDNTLLIKIDPKVDDFSFNGILTIEWYYENDAELFTLICLKRHIDTNFTDTKVSLFMPYIPHARMDRVKNTEDVFTLKYFCEVINSLKFKSVLVRDAHSNVSLALLDNVVDLNVISYVNRVLNFSKAEVLFFPDEGAMKRYSSAAIKPYAFGLKERDWKTGQIKGLTLINEEVIKDRDVLIVDDICSRGGTFYHSAKALKEAGAKNIYLYITHCENTILEGELLTSGLIERVYTTNSIFTKEHEKIEVFEL